jgi:hypothetical protein
VIITIDVPDWIVDQVRQRNVVASSACTQLVADAVWKVLEDPTTPQTGPTLDLSPQAWCDLAPHLSCREADRVHAYLLATRDAWTAQVFIEAHANSDDDEGDLHYQGGGADS